MRKIRLNERDLINIVRRVIKEETQILKEDKVCTDDKDCETGGPRARCIKGKCGHGEPKDDGKNVKKELAFEGKWSEIASGVKKAKAAGGFGKMSEAQALKWVTSVIGDPNDPPKPGKIKCGGADEFGGGRWCLKVSLKGWRLTICLGSDC